MNDKKEWQEANRELIAEERLRLGDPPTAEEMLAYTRGELSEAEEERIRDLLVAYPELARMYYEPVPEEPRPGDSDHVSAAQVAAGWNALQQRLRTRGDAPSARDEAQRGRVLFMRYVPNAVAAMVAVVFFGLFVQSEFRARHYAGEARQPHILGAPQELIPDGNRGPGAPTLLSKDGDAYLLRPHLVNQLKYPHYRIELHDAQGATIWTNNTAQPDDEDDTFQIVVPHAFLSEGETYQLRIFGVDGETLHPLGTYDLSVPAE